MFRGTAALFAFALFAPGGEAPKDLPLVFQEDFEKGEGGGMYLRAEASKRFLGKYERWMLHGPPGGKQEGFRAALRKEVQSYAASLRDSEPSAYQPYLLQAAEEHAPEEER